MATSNEYVLPATFLTRKWEIQSVTTQNPVIEANAAACDIFQIVADNTANGFQLYLKVYDTSGTVTVGTTQPDFIFPLPAGETIDYSFVGHPMTLNTRLKLVISKEAGTANATPLATWTAVSVTFYGTE
jgi:hypothetical protein